jgi:hypothetical protein
LAGSQIKIAVATAIPKRGFRLHIVGASIVSSALGVSRFAVAAALIKRIGRGQVGDDVG